MPQDINRQGDFLVKKREIFFERMENKNKGLKKLKNLFIG